MFAKRVLCFVSTSAEQGETERYLCTLFSVTWAIGADSLSTPHSLSALPTVCASTSAGVLVIRSLDVAWQLHRHLHELFAPAYRFDKLQSMLIYSLVPLLPSQSISLTSAVSRLWLPCTLTTLHFGRLMQFVATVFVGFFTNDIYYFVLDTTFHDAVIPHTIALHVQVPCARLTPTMYTSSLSLHTPQPSHALPPFHLEHLTFNVRGLCCAVQVRVIVIKVLCLLHARHATH